MRPTSSWVNERSSKYLIYLAFLSNSQPSNQFLHREKKTDQNNLKYQSKTNIYVNFVLALYIYKMSHKKVSIKKFSSELLKASIYSF